jgi:putative aldouronate transport system substrate-binding protein
MAKHHKVLLIAVLLFVVLAVPGLFAGGTKEEEVTGPAVTAPGEFPVVPEKVTVNIFASLHPYTGDMTKNWFTEYYENKTNVHIEWEQIPDEQAPEKVNVLIAAGDLPEAFLHGDFTFTRSQLMVNGAAGIFRPLNDLIEKHSVALKKIFQERPYVKTAMTAPDGNIYALPAIGECYHCVHEVRAWINKPWIDKLGLKVPETTDDLYNVLRAFRDRDPNGNGKADEIPMSGAISRGGYNNEVDKWLMNAFIYSYYEDSGERAFVHVENNKVFFAANTPQWREGLRYIRKLYRENLIDPEAFTQARDPGLKQKGENPEAQILGFVPSGSISAFNIYYGESGRYKEWVLVPPLKGPAGYQVAYTGPYRILPGFEVTSAAKRPDVIMRWADWFYTREGTLMAMNGEEGVGWRKGQPGEVGANGKPAVYVRLQPYGRKQDFAWASTSLHDVSVDLFNGQASTREFDQGPILFRAANLYDQYRPKEFLPYLWFTEAEAAEMAELQLAIKDYVVSSDAEFITDRRDVDGADWQSYLKELENLGVKRYVELTQKAYDAVLANQ